MILPFEKYHGTGNDFIVIDNRSNIFSRNSTRVGFLCNRRLGIGADGLMLIENKEGYDFSMRYFNSDGYEGSMCGNGGRCISAFYYKNIALQKKLHFYAIDGEHRSEILMKENANNYLVKLCMQDVEKVEFHSNDFFLNTGSPHVVKFVDNADEIDVATFGKQIRFSSEYAPSGTNVSFVEKQEGKLFVRTYERGVEDETLSCGTGVTASAIAASFTEDSNNFDIITLGGNLHVSFQKAASSFTHIWLEGPATLVYSGKIEI